MPILEGEEKESLLQNKDMKTFYNLCHQIMSKDPELLAKTYNAGHVNCARWITTCSNIMLLYTLQKDPSPRLVMMVMLILNVYAPALFSIKRYWHISDGPKNFFKRAWSTQNLTVRNPRNLTSLTLGP